MVGNSDHFSRFWVEVVGISDHFSGSGRVWEEVVGKPDHFSQNAGFRAELIVFTISDVIILPGRAARIISSLGVGSWGVTFSNVLDAASC